MSPHSPVSPYLVTNKAICVVRFTVPHSVQSFFGEREDLMLIIKWELVIANTLKTPECFVFLKWKKTKQLDWFIMNLCHAAKRSARDFPILGESAE